MRLPTMLIKRIGIIKALPTKLAQRMILSHMPTHLLGSVEAMLVGEDFLVVGAQVADGGLVGRAAVTFEVGPGLEDGVAGWGGAVEAEEGDGGVHLGAGFEG